MPPIPRDAAQVGKIIFASMKTLQNYGALPSSMSAGAICDKSRRWLITNVKDAVATITELTGTERTRSGYRRVHIPQSVKRGSHNWVFKNTYVNDMRNKISMTTEKLEAVSTVDDKITNEAARDTVNEAWVDQFCSSSS